MREFAGQDLERAGEWLPEFDGAPSAQEEMTKRYAMILSSVDPEAPLPWIKGIQNEKKRDRVKRKILKNWEIEDPEAFAEWKTR